ncbi:SUKH-3 domain-containing protein [Streptomyces bungoensis]
MSRFSTETEEVLRSAGWLPGRRTNIESWKEQLTQFSWHAAAEGFLAEFGGLTVSIDGPGVTCAREPFRIDPVLAVGEEERFEELSDLFSRRFFPVGEFGVGDFFLGIDEEGVLYLLAAWAFRLGKSDEGLESLIKGVKGVKLSTDG